MTPENPKKYLSTDCAKLTLGYYPDLLEQIQEVTTQVENSLYDFLDEEGEEFLDPDFAEYVTGSLFHLSHRWKNADFRELVFRVDNIQSKLRYSRLNEEQREAFWQPIAECYTSVQAALKERIIPYEDRELIKIGGTVLLPFKIWGGYLIPNIPRFKYKVEKSKDGEATGKEGPLVLVEFEKDHLSSLPPNVSNKLYRIKGDLPVKIVSYDTHMRVIVEIDVEKFREMYCQD